MLINATFAAQKLKWLNDDVCELQNVRIQICFPLDFLSFIVRVYQPGPLLDNSSEMKLSRQQIYFHYMIQGEHVMDKDHYLAPVDEQNMQMEEMCLQNFSNF